MQTYYIAVHIFLKHIYSIGIILHCNELASQCKPYIYSCRRPDLHLQLSGFRRSFPIMKKISLWHGTVKRQQQQSGTSWRKHHRKIVKAFKAHVKASRRVAAAEEFFQATQKALEELLSAAAVGKKGSAKGKQAEQQRKCNTCGGPCHAEYKDEKGEKLCMMCHTKRCRQGVI